MLNPWFRSIQIAAVFLLVITLSACYRAAPVSSPASRATQPSGDSPSSALTPSTAISPIAIASPQPTATPLVLSAKEVTFQDIRFLLPAELGIGVSSQNAPVTEILGESYPAHIEFTVEGYPSSNTSFEPLIRIYPVSELGVVATSTAQQLKKLLAEQPASLPPTLPVLPALPAGQLVHAGGNYLTFGGGSGVRLLTQFAQNSWPVNNEGLVYVFQGLTNDDRFYVSAFLPISASFLPDKVDEPETVPDVDGVPFPAFDSQGFDAEYARYQEAVTQKLETASPEQFEPALSLLDGLIQSLQIKVSSEASENMPCVGAPPTRLQVNGFAYVNPNPPLPNNLRQDAGKENDLIGEIQPGGAMKILDGPKCADGWVWWQVRTFEPELEGWTAEGDHQNYWLIPCASRNECAPK